jgi:hypothetical protein
MKMSSFLKSGIISFFISAVLLLIFACTVGPVPKIEEPPVPDTTPPQTAIDSPTNGQVVYTNINLFGFVSDDRAVDGVYISLDSNSFQRVGVSGITNWSTNLALTDGSHRIDFYAKDQAGNVSPTYEIIVTADSSMPSLTIDNPLDNSYVNTNFGVSGQAYSNGPTPIDRVYLSVDGGAYGLASGTENWSSNLILTGGFHTIRAYAMNTNGLSSAPSQIVVRIDTLCPTNTISSPINDSSFTNLAFTISGVSTDDIAVSNVYISLDSDPFSPAAGSSAWSTNVTTTLGVHSLRSYSMDFTGKVSPTNSISFLAGAVWLCDFGRYSNGALPGNPGDWWTSTNVNGYFKSYVTNAYQAPGRTNSKSFYIEGSTSAGYWIGAAGTSVSFLLNGDNSWGPIDLSMYGKIRFYITNLTGGEHTVPSFNFVDNQCTTPYNYDTSVLAKWSTHNYTNNDTNSLPPNYWVYKFPPSAWYNPASEFRGGGQWFELNLEYTNTNQSGVFGTTNLFCFDPTEQKGRKDGIPFDWYNTVGFKFSFAATGAPPGAGTGSYAICDIMLIPR